MNTDLMLEQMNIVIVGHVDHGKSTFIGRLLADTGSLPEGKLEQIKALCARNAKPFEYAFLLDALKDEQAQGITIDTARSFFKTNKRRYIIIDAPGHIEFLKNMVSGAARAEAALLLIDAKEGIQENSRRHGFMLSMLGVKQVIVLVNKMDLVNYDQTVFESIQEEYTRFLAEINVTPQAFVPISAFNGDNLIEKSSKIPWYKGSHVLDLIDAFEKEKDRSEQAFRMPVQDIYKFTELNDDRRIVAGTIETGKVKVGDEVVFYPSEKTSRIKSIEEFNSPARNEAGTGLATGVTLETQIYIRPGEMMCKMSESRPEVSTLFKANLFWLGKRSLMVNKKYKIKIGSMRETVYLKSILRVLDASSLENSFTKTQIDRNDVAECIFQSVKPLVFDLTKHIEQSSRFVIVDQYDIGGGGIIIESVSDETEDRSTIRQYAWERGFVTEKQRAQRFNQKAKLIMITGQSGKQKMTLAKELERRLFSSGRSVYYLGVSDSFAALQSGVSREVEDREEHIRHLAEIATMFIHAGLIVLATVTDMNDRELRLIQEHTDNIILITVGSHFIRYNKVDFELQNGEDLEGDLNHIIDLLRRHDVFGDYVI